MPSVMYVHTIFWDNPNLHLSHVILYCKYSTIFIYKSTYSYVESVILHSFYIHSSIIYPNIIHLILGYMITQAVHACGFRPYHMYDRWTPPSQVISIILCDDFCKLMSRTTNLIQTLPHLNIYFYSVHYFI